MIIDFHTHTFPDFLAPKVITKLEKGASMHAFVDGTVKALDTSMHQANVDISIVLPVATSPTQVPTCNKGAVLLNEESKDRMISFGAMHPEFEEYREELKRIKEAGIKGIKLHPDYQQTMFDDIRYKRIIDTASELGLITLVHTGLDIGLPGPIHATPKMIHNLIRDVKPEKIVLAHMGGFQLWEEALELLAGEHVYLDTAFSLGSIQYYQEVPVEKRLHMMPESLFVDMIQGFGEDRIVFATDSPWGGQKETLQVFHHLPITEKQKEKILWSNAAKLLEL